jgi:hypothetical protein
LRRKPISFLGRATGQPQGTFFHNYIRPNFIPIPEGKTNQSSKGRVLDLLGPIFPIVAAAQCELFNTCHQYTLP